MNEIRRRAFLGGSAVALGVAATGRTTAVHATEEAPPTNAGRAATSANGWPIEEHTNGGASTVWRRPVSGTGMVRDVRVGPVEALLLHVVRRLHYEVEPLEAGQLTGWRPVSGLRRRHAESNLASGTAVRFREGTPVDAFFPLQVQVIRDILLDCDGLVRWGGDDRRVDQSLFYVCVPPTEARVETVAAALRSGAERPGGGAGAPVEVTAARSRRARGLARRQRRD